MTHIIAITIQNLVATVPYYSFAYSLSSNTTVLCSVQYDNYIIIIGVLYNMIIVTTAAQCMQDGYMVQPGQSDRAWVRPGGASPSIFPAIARLVHYYASH